MSIKHNRNKGAATTDRQSKHKPTETVAEPIAPPDKPLIIADMSMKKAELVEIAETMGLNTKGTKAELIDRIQA